MSDPVQPLPVSGFTIAVPVENGRLHGHFGGAPRFALAEVDRARKAVLLVRMLMPPPHAPGAFPHWLRRQGVGAVIVGGIGQRALSLFAEQGIEVRAGPPGTPLEELIARYLEGTLPPPAGGCSHHDHGHPHAPRHHNRHPPPHSPRNSGGPPPAGPATCL